MNNDMLDLQNISQESREPEKKSLGKKLLMKKHIFKYLFIGIELLWKVIKIFQYLKEIFSFWI